ncbi:hypothetical protein [Maricaulis maris]|uniref:hypothetical protein n=1 Tax=Maricaulis maris TaxID=74318 RepID=UPI003A9355CB
MDWFDNHSDELVLAVLAGVIVAGLVHALGVVGKRLRSDLARYTELAGEIEQDPAKFLSSGDLILHLLSSLQIEFMFQAIVTYLFGLAFLAFSALMGSELGFYFGAFVVFLGTLPHVGLVKSSSARRKIAAFLWAFEQAERSGTQGAIK